MPKNLPGRTHQLRAAQRPGRDCSQVRAVGLCCCHMYLQQLLSPSQCCTRPKPTDRALLCRGSMNGLDFDEWDPSTDPHLSAGAQYIPASVKQGKAAAKAWFQQPHGLARDPDVPLFAFVGQACSPEGSRCQMAAAPALLNPRSMPHPRTPGGFRACRHPRLQLVMLGERRLCLQRAAAQGHTICRIHHGAVPTSTASLDCVLLTCMQAANGLTTVSCTCAGGARPLEPTAVAPWRGCWHHTIQ